MHASRTHPHTDQAGVSAGGWLARIALGSVPYKGHVFGLRGLVHTLVCLGTPHASLEAYPFGRAEVCERLLCRLLCAYGHSSSTTTHPTLATPCAAPHRSPGSTS
jgi:hypothetical protein